MEKITFTQIIVLVIWCFLGAFVCGVAPMEYKYIIGYLFGCGSQIILLYNGL